MATLKLTEPHEPPTLRHALQQRVRMFFSLLFQYGPAVGALSGTILLQPSPGPVRDALGLVPHMAAHALEGEIKVDVDGGKLWEACEEPEGPRGCTETWEAVEAPCKRDSDRDPGLLLSLRVLSASAEPLRRDAANKNIDHEMAQRRTQQNMKKPNGSKETPKFLENPGTLVNRTEFGTCRTSQRRPICFDIVVPLGTCGEVYRYKPYNTHLYARTCGQEQKLRMAQSANLTNKKNLARTRIQSVGRPWWQEKQRNKEKEPSRCFRTDIVREISHRGGAAKAGNNDDTAAPKRSDHAGSGTVDQGLTASPPRPPSAASCRLSGAISPGEVTNARNWGRNNKANG
ncbi:hypothetical protein V8F20_009761 [Naviculisporaceae sp. PSN 640]